MPATALRTKRVDRGTVVDAVVGVVWEELSVVMAKDDDVAMGFGLLRVGVMEREIAEETRGRGGFERCQGTKSEDVFDMHENLSFVCRENPNAVKL